MLARHVSGGRPTKFIEEIMKLTVITIAYNNAKDIGRTIESVLAQEQGDNSCTIEYLIVDGASSDDTVSVAESYITAMKNRGIEYRISSEPDTGIYDAMNKGIDRATGDIIGILNSGDWYEPTAAVTAANTFADTGCDLVYANIRIHKIDGNTFVKKARQRRFQTSRDWNHPTTFVRAALYKQYPFRCLGIHDDYGFFLQMRRQGRHIVTVDKVLANFAMGGASNRKDLKAAKKRIMDRYRYCYRINGYSRLYILECVVIEAAKMLLG